jgi:hypothetical protein
MSNAELDLLMPILVQLPARLVRTTVASRELLDEAAELEQRLEAEGLGERLDAIGVPPAAIERMLSAASALRAAQARWEALRDAGRTEQARVVEARGRSLRTRLVAVCRWNLRGHAAVRNCLAEMDRDDTILSLIAELEALAGFVGQRLTAFQSDRSVDAFAYAEQARAIAAELRALAPESVLTREQLDAYDLRDRARTYLADAVDALKDALRYLRSDGLGAAAWVPLARSAWYASGATSVARA